MQRIAEITNATKAVWIALVNSTLVLIEAFGVDVSDNQQIAIVGFVNAVLLAWVGLTYAKSAKRVPDA